jgi:DNA-binding GntR family transcriptional regulator
MGANGFDLPATLVELAAHRLREAILRGALKPGEKIVEEQLCADFGISRAPLREALRLLAQQGLVEHLPRRGSRVTEWSPADILQDPETALAPVRDALEVMRLAGDELARDDAHRGFHAAVVELADNRQLNITLEPILLKLQLPMATNLRAEARHHRAAEGLKRHRAILSALQTNDPQTVLTALEGHGHLHYLGLQPDR